MTINLIDKQFEFNLWANTDIIKLCKALSEEQLSVEAEGVFGRIKPLLIHTIGAEGWYISRSTGQPNPAADVDWDNISWDDLLKQAQISGQGLVDTASGVELKTRHIVDVDFQDDPIHFFNWTVLLQAILHGIEHRTQIKVLLTKLGVEHPDYSAWSYIESMQDEIVASQ